MSSSFVPVRLPFSLVRALIGCRDEAVFKRHVQNLRKGLAEIDELLEERDDSPYDAEFVSAVKSQQPAADPELERFDLRMAEIKKRMAKGESVEGDIESFISDVVLAFHEAEPAPVSKLKEEPTGSLPDAKTVLRHLMFGDPVDVRIGFAYNSVTQLLCRKLGQKLPNQNWVEMKHISDWFGELDQVLTTHGIPNDVFSFSDHLLERGNPFVGAPCDDVPFIGYLTNAEMAKIYPLLHGLNLKPGDSEFPETYLVDVRNWMKTCLSEDEDLICFTN